MSKKIVKKATYSKPSSDISMESKNLAEGAVVRFREQLLLNKYLETFEERKNCILCGAEAALGAETSPPRPIARPWS